MRRLVLLVPLAACGSSAPATKTPAPEVPDAGVAAATQVVSVAVHALWLPIACGGEVEGVGGGRRCLDDQTPTLPATGCTDANGELVGVMAADDAPSDFLLAGDAIAVTTSRTDPRDKVTHNVDLDGDGDREVIVLVPHDNRASYGRSVVITDGHDPLMTDELDPFPDAADLQLLGTSDVDGDGRRELIFYAPDEGGFGIAVQEHWSAGEAYRLDCRDP